jgi:hypothetical protein
VECYAPDLEIFPEKDLLAEDVDITVIAVLASAVETEMKPPDPLPKTLPKGTTAGDRSWITRTSAILKLGGYHAFWVGGGSSLSKEMTIPAEEIDWPEEGFSPLTVGVTMDDARLEELLSGIKGWPLSKSETFTAFALMGLTSRLQPAQVNSLEQQALVVDLSIKLGAATAAKVETK